VTRDARRGAAALPLLGALAAAALLLPSADRETLVVQGIGRLLSRDLGAFAAEPRGLFRALDELGGEREPEHLCALVRVDGAPLRSIALDRTLAAHLNRYSEAHRAGRTPLRLVPPGAPCDLELRLAVSTGADRVRLRANLSDGASTVAVPLSGSWAIPGRGALLPPLLAVIVALTLRRTLLALFVGIYAGVVLLAAGDGAAAMAPLRGLVDLFGVYLVGEVLDTFRIELIGFVVALIAMVGVMSRAGGVRGLLERLLDFAHTVRSSLLITYGMGLLIFFDDYANCMLVGSTMRPLTDRLRVSREKLAYVVDSTAAPVAGISLVSTWIAFQVSVYSAQLPEVGITDSGYVVFLQTLPFRFYSLLTLLFVGLVIATGRDFGPMARAEARARVDGQLLRAGGRPPISDDLARIEPAPGMPLDWRVAVVPLALTLGVTIVRMGIDGGARELAVRDPAALLTLEGATGVLLAGSGAGAILTGAIAGLLCASFMVGSNAARGSIAAGLALGAAGFAPLRPHAEPLVGPDAAGYVAALALFTIGAGLAGLLFARTRPATARVHLSFAELRSAGIASAGTLVFAVVLLFEAWMIGAVCRDLSTADYLVALLSGALPPVALPLLLFGAASLVAFATGSSWSTMSILLPNVVGLAASLGTESALGVAGMVALCISAVLEGAIFGDHCSPISDTTVLSSMASASDHIDHVRTQAPYALVVAGAAVLCGYLPLLFVPFWTSGVALASGAGLLLAVLLGVGRHAPPARLAGADLVP
jgi:Na+/H+ antiporter NhaC